MSKTRNVPLAMDDELLAEIDRVAGLVGENRSAAMRMAIRAGLPLVERRHKPSGLEDMLLAQGDPAAYEQKQLVNSLAARMEQLEKRFDQAAEPAREGSPRKRRK